MLIHPAIRLNRAGSTMVIIIMRHLLLSVSTYIFPIFGTPLLIWVWWRIANGNWRLVALVIAVPLLFGYFTGFVATSLLKRWRMSSGWRVGGAYVHHGFI